MKKHQLSSSARPSVKELTELFERSAAGTSSSRSPSMKVAPQKPPRTNRGSVKAPARLDHAEQSPHTRERLEQSAESASASRSPSMKVAPQKPPRTNRGSVKAPAKLDHTEQSPHTRERLEQSAESASASRSPSMKVAPQKPPRTNRGSVKAPAKLDHTEQSPHTRERLEQSAASTSTSRSPSMKVAPQKPPRTNRGLEQSAATSSTSSASQSSTVSLSKEQIICLASHHSLVKVYAQEIQRLCRNVYGNEGALRNQMEKIQKSPTKESDLPWILLNHPQSIAKLSGSTTCGIKNSARRHAEESVSSLSSAVECYLQAAQYAQKSLSESPETELQYYQRTLSSETLAKILKNPHHLAPERMTAPEEEIANIARRSSTVTRHEEQIKHWCSVVFGNKDILNEEIKGILKDTSQGEHLVQNLEDNPTSFHKFRGRDVCGIKSRARVRAENGLEHLCTAITNYTDDIKQIREHVTQTHQTQHTRHEQSASLGKSLQNKQALSQSFKEAEQRKKPEARLCKASTQKALSFAS